MLLLFVTSGSVVLLLVATGSVVVLGFSCVVVCSVGSVISVVIEVVVGPDPVK